MADDERHSLTDDQIQCDYRTDPEPMREAFRHLDELEGRISDRDDSETVEIPVETARRVAMGMRMFAKSNSEFLGQAGGDTGDRGSNCDYNPFNRVNTGDFANIFG